MIDGGTHDDLNAVDAREWLRLAVRGEFDAAWQVSDRIRARTQKVHDASQPRHLQQIWNGEPLAGRRVLIRCYHGLGDTIQFIRYAPLVKAIAREVIVWAQPALLPLLQSAPGIDRLLPLHDGIPDVEYDVDIEVMELPYAFRTNLSTIPDGVPYLNAEARRLHGTRPLIGVAWRAGEWDTRRSIPFNQLTPLFDAVAADWYALQLDVRPDEQSPRLRMVDTRGLARMAEVMRGLDLVITIDSMPAHLAGALAIPVWTILPYDVDWRWMAHRSDTPWYRTMRLFRQLRAGEWRGVIDEVQRALTSRYGTTAHPIAAASHS